MKKIHIGIVLTYFTLALNTVSGFLLTPLMLKSLGELEYSVYQLIVSLSGYLTVINLGTGAAMNRFVSAYRTKNDKDGECNYIMINIFTTVILMVVVIIIGFYMRTRVSGWFPNIIKSENYGRLAMALCGIVTINVAVNFLGNSFEGLLQAYGRIDITKFFVFFKLMIRLIACSVLLKLGFGSLAITLVDSVLIVCYLIFVLMVLRRTCDFRFKISKFRVDRRLFAETMTFSIASVLSGLSGQLNNNIDKTVLARCCNEFEITIYAIATTFYTMFTSVGTSLNNVYLNKMTEIVYSDTDNVRLENMNIKIGRFQNFVVGMIFFGFICLGKDFIRAWLGVRYESVFYYSLILIFPNYFVCIGGVQETILDAKNKKIVKSIIVFIIGIMNLLVTIGMVNVLGGIGAPLGTMIALVLGYNICLNIYFQKNLKINVIRMYKEIIKGFLPAQLATVVIVMIIFFFMRNISVGLWMRFFINGIIFVIVYVGIVGMKGLNLEEKRMIKNVINRK